jgi:hypothetical protein
LTVKGTSVIHDRASVKTRPVFCYYKHPRPGDYFINDLSGVGYIHEDVFADNCPATEQQRILKEFQRLSGIYRARLDTTVMAMLAEMRPEMLATLPEIPGMTAVFANYVRTHATTPANTVAQAADLPVFLSINRPPTELTFAPDRRESAELVMIGEIKRWTPAQGPAFLHVFLANWLTHIQMLENIAKGLGPEYVAVRPDQLVVALCGAAT